MAFKFEEEDLVVRWNRAVDSIGSEIQIPQLAFAAGFGEGVAAGEASRAIDEELAYGKGYMEGYLAAKEDFYGT